MTREGTGWTNHKAGRGTGAGFLWRVQVSSYYSQASKEVCNGMYKEEESQKNLETVNYIGQHENTI